MNDDLIANKTLARRWIRAFDDEDLDTLGSLLTDDIVYHQMTPPAAGRAEVLAMARRVYAAWRPHRLVVEDEIAERDRVVLRMTAYDTHVGSYLGIVNSGKEIRWAVTFIFRIDDGRIAEIWRTADDLARVRQVGGRVVGPQSEIRS